MTYRCGDATPGATARANRLFALEISERLPKENISWPTTRGWRWGKSRTATRFGFSSISGRKGVRTEVRREQTVRETHARSPGATTSHSAGHPRPKQYSGRTQNACCTRGHTSDQTGSVRPTRGKSLHRSATCITNGHPCTPHS